MTKVLIALPLVLFLLVLFLLALWWRTKRQNSAHKEIAALKAIVAAQDARIADLESLIQEPIVRMDMRMRHKLRNAG